MVLETGNLKLKHQKIQFSGEGCSLLLRWCLNAASTGQNTVSSHGRRWESKIAQSWEELFL
jgi:hypothetical protein